MTDAQTAPIPIIGAAHPFRGSFRSLSHRNYRRFQLAHFALHAGAWMFRVAIDWLALEITGNVAAVGLLVFVQWAPIIVLGPYGAMIADRFPRRVTVSVVYGLFGVLTAMLAGLTMVGVVELWHVVVVAFLFGLIYTVEIPARVVLLSEMVPPSDLPNAISVYAIVFWLGGVLGPLLSALIIATAGSGWSIMAYSVACVGVALTVATLRTDELRVIPSTTELRPRFRETVTYARSKSTIIVPLIVIGFFAVFALPIGVVLSGVARSVFDSGPSGLGLYSAMLSLGALVGAILSTRVRALRLRTVIVTALAFALLQLVSGLVPVEPMFLVLLFGVGCLRLVYEVVSDQLVQLSCNPLIRGRVVSLYVTVVAGGQALGGPMLGALSDVLGPQAVLVISGAVPLVAASVIGVLAANRSSFTRVFRLGRGRSPLGSVVREPD
ncbi:MAG: MFS transporter [Microcella sp.]